MRYYLALIIFCLLFFGYAMFGGRPLTMHEARLPQLTREMVSSDKLADYLVPKSGGRVWIERPPPPAWLTAVLAAPLGGLHHVWQARFPAAIMGLLGVLFICAITTRLYGEKIGLLAGFIQATMFEYFSYAWLIEDDIFLCVLIYAIILVFVKLEFPPKNSAENSLISAPPKFGFWQNRSASVYLLFILLGLTNLTKGPVFGTVIALIPIAGYLLLSRSWQKIRRYCWFWGWLLFLIVVAAWTIPAELLAPGSWRVWHFNLFARLLQGYLRQPFYYYFKYLPTMLAPWTIFALLGLWRLSCEQQGKLLWRREAATYFMLSWAVLTILVLSISQSKHHHYLLSNTGAWAILSALGLFYAWEKISAKFLSLKRYGVVLFATTMVIIAIGGALIHTFILPRNDRTRDDTEFLQQVNAELPQDALLFINAQGSMDFFRNQFYTDNRAVLLHNFPYLTDEKYQLRGKQIYLIDRVSRQEQIAQYGKVEIILESKNSRRAAEHGGNFALMHIEIAEDLPYQNIPPVTPMQVMELEP